MSKSPASRWAFLVALLVSVSLLPAKEAPPAAAPLKIYPDISYLETGRSEKLDIFLPSGQAPEGGFPAVVLIHGGGFSGGSKDGDSVTASSLRLAKAGFVVANIGYALSKPDAPQWPKPLLDCKNAVRYLRSHAAEYGINPDRIGVIGFSAGGQLALLTGMTTGNKDLEPANPYPGVSDKVNAVVNFYGGTNFLSRRKPDPTGEPTGEPYYSSGRNLLGGNGPDDNPAIWKQASPVNHASKDNPAILTVHGTGDKIVDYWQAQELAKALDAVQVPNKLILLPKIGHAFYFDQRREFPPDFNLFEEVVSFLGNPPAAQR